MPSAFYWRSICLIHLELPAAGPVWSHPSPTNNQQRPPKLPSVLTVAPFSSQSCCRALQPHLLLLPGLLTACSKARAFLSSGLITADSKEPAFLSLSQNPTDASNGSSNLALGNVSSHSTTRFPFFEFVFICYFIPFLFFSKLIFSSKLPTTFPACLSGINTKVMSLSAAGSAIPKAAQ